MSFCLSHRRIFVSSLRGSRRQRAAEPFSADGAAPAAAANAAPLTEMMEL